MRTSAAAIVVVGMVSGCQYGPYQFTCTDDASCGAGGKCESGFNLCSFANPSCRSGRAFGDLGGAHAGQCVDSQPGSDGGSSPDAARFCYGATLLTICFATAPTVPIDVSTPTIFDTVNGLVSGIPLPCATPVSGGAGYCVLAAKTITVSNSLRVIGANPVVLVAADTIDVSALLDVGSHRKPTESTGAGSDPSAACAARAGTAPSSSGGGAGGSFLGRGGAGGSHGTTNGGGVAGAASGVPGALRGGCPGQDGSAAVTADRGVGGHGGGAVFLIAGNKIMGSGSINAGGEGGRGGQVIGPGMYSGGGGGGAGGMIGLDAPTITFTGMLSANGGGGAEGSGDSLPGQDGKDATSTTVATGGGGDTIGGDGGDGSTGPASGPGSEGVGDASGGGGGGGGGAGLIKVPANASLGPNVSPARTP